MEKIKTRNRIFDKIKSPSNSSDITRLVFNEINNLNISNLYYEIEKNSKIGRHFEVSQLERKNSKLTLQQLIR